MGNDAPLSCLTMYPQLVFDYFKQLFAQVSLFTCAVSSVPVNFILQGVMQFFRGVAQSIAL